MAQAPPPGTGRRLAAAAEAEQAERTAFRLTYKGEVRELYFADLGPADSARSRRETGIPIEAHFANTGAFASDTVVMLWWFAGVKSGDPRLAAVPWEQALAEFPTFADVADIVLEEVTPEPDAEPVVDSPEVSAGSSAPDGPASPPASDSTPGTSAAIPS